MLVTRPTPEGPSPQRIGFEEWPTQIEFLEVDLLEAFDGDPSAHVSGTIAVVWGAYRLELGGELTHTKTDAVRLPRTQTDAGEAWRVASIAFRSIPVSGKGCRAPANR